MIDSETVRWVEESMGDRLDHTERLVGGIAAYQSMPVPVTDRLVLLHRDFHPLNVLWVDGHPAGVVDWVNACVGHPHADLGHCRWNLRVLVNSDAADSFLHTYVGMTRTGEYSRWWDIAAVMGFLPGPLGTTAWNEAGRSDLGREFAVGATEHFLRAALKEL